MNNQNTPQNESQTNEPQVDETAIDAEVMALITGGIGVVRRAECDTCHAAPS